MKIEKVLDLVTSIPAFIHTITEEDTTSLDEIFRRFGCARRRAYVMKQKGKNRRQIELALLDMGLNSRYLTYSHD